MLNPKKFEKIFKDIWPHEYDIIVRPERLKYVRRLVKPTSCVFCVAAETKQRRKKLVLLRTEHTLVVINKYPYNNGHLLVIPRGHYSNLEDMSEQEYYEVQNLILESVKILKKTYNCHGLNVGLNLGAISGAGIPDHLHYHIIPRWGGDTNFFPLIAKTKLVIETNDDTFKRLKTEFSKLEKRLCQK